MSVEIAGNVDGFRAHHHHLPAQQYLLGHDGLGHRTLGPAPSATFFSHLDIQPHSCLPHLMEAGQTEDRAEGVCAGHRTFSFIFLFLPSHTNTRWEVVWLLMLVSNGYLDGAVDWSLQVAWSSSQHGSWVPMTSILSVLLSTSSWVLSAMAPRGSLPTESAEASWNPQEPGPSFFLKEL